MKKWFRPGSAFNARIPHRPLGLASIVPPFLVILALWVAYWLDARFALELFQFGVYPRQIFGLKGLVLAPLVHGGLNHLVNNTFPLLILGVSLFYFYPRQAWWVLLLAWLGSGLGTWLFARESYHIGASGVVYALAAFVFFSGILRGNAQLLALSLFTAFVYGGLVWGLLPMETQVSHEAHLAGSLSGLLLALLLGRRAQPEEEIPLALPPNDDLSEQIERFGDQYWLPPEQRDVQSKEAPFRYIYRRDEKKN